MRRLMTASWVILAIMGVIMLLASCSTGATSNQPTVTATVTVTAAPSGNTTSSVPKTTPPAPSSIVPAVTTPATSTPATTAPATTKPASTTADVNNNPHFFISRDVAGWVTPTVLIGNPVPSPIMKDVYLDLDLGGYFTNKDAYFNPRIPRITDHDDWYYFFDIPVYKLPWILNWGYATRSNNPNTTFSFNVYKKDDFLNLFNKSPGTLTLYKLGVDRGESADGIRCVATSDTGSFAVMMRTNNPDDIAGWWVKYGGQKFGQ